MLGGLGRVSASFPAMGLVERLHVRATSIALGSLLDRLEAQLAGDVPAGAGEGEAGARKGEEELYVRLHLVLSTVWQKRIPGLWTGNAATLSMFAAVALICIFFNIIGGLCIPAYALSISAFVLSIFLLDLSGIAAGNSQIRSVSALYSSAQQSLRRLALLHPSHPLLPALDRHDRMLGSFTDARAYEMRFWGFAVGYGTVRTIAATVLTVGFGLWSVARGSGVYVTPETVCY
ncbi:hypothetical protein DFJ74DRAFT_658567 [Hyaloraphidium curvatum]|nr:hypothetical protein DFJ74DRAFT_658567 [Hyaloraphidium curvatum]